LRSAQLSIVIPTFKERGNVAELVRRLDQALAGIAWEAIFVDDNSPDGTAEAVKEIGRGDSRVRCIRRVGRRGLAGACIEGMLSSSAPYVAVIDADLQHDEKVLPKMLVRLESGEADLVAGTRYVEGGSAASFSEGRGAVSRLATRLTHRLVGTPLSDPMSGFFMLRRDRFDAIAPRLSPAGFKILLDIAATPGERLKIAEQPYEFGERFAGESKFSAQIGVEFLGLLLAKMSGGLVDPRFIFFAIVGTLGLIVHLTVLTLALAFLPAQPDLFRVAQVIATLVAMTSNFLLNNELTYRDRRLKGLAALRGFVLFCLLCSAGALANVDLASWLYADRQVWWLAGAAGAIMGALWNYAMSTLFVWRVR
jgi:dolichol-phosphate mannosyltransferase